MKFLIHYLARTPLAPLHFDFVTGLQPSAANLDDLRAFMAGIATAKTRRARVFDADDIIIANIIPLPDAPAAKQLEGGE